MNLKNPNIIQATLKADWNVSSPNDNGEVVCECTATGKAFQVQESGDVQFIDLPPYTLTTVSTQEALLEVNGEGRSIVEDVVKGCAIQLMAEGYHAQVTADLIAAAEKSTLEEDANEEGTEEV